MNDFETIKEIFTRAGVVFTEIEPEGDDGPGLTLEIGTGPKNNGGSGGGLDINFTPAGDLEDIYLGCE